MMMNANGVNNNNNDDDGIDLQSKRVYSMEVINMWMDVRPSS